MLLVKCKRWEKKKWGIDMKRTRKINKNRKRRQTRKTRKNVNNS
jgi:hypothetical protein